MDGVDEEGRTPLHIAASLGVVETLKSLVGLGAYPKIRDKEVRFVIFVFLFLFFFSDLIFFSSRDLHLLSWRRLVGRKNARKY